MGESPKAELSAYSSALESFSVFRGYARRAYPYLTGGSNLVEQPEVVYSYNIPANGGYDGVGNLRSVSDSVMGSWSYTPDDLNRLSSATATAGAYASVGLIWAYDGFGNRWAQTEVAPVVWTGFSGL